MCKIKPGPLGRCYANSVDRRLGTSLYQSTPSLFKLKQLNWPKLVLPIIFFQFKMGHLAVTDNAKIRLRSVGLYYADGVDR